MIWLKLRINGCLDPATTIAHMSRLVREAQNAEDRWAHWVSLLPGMLIREDLLSRKGRAWAHDFYFERKSANVSENNIPAGSPRMSFDEVGARSSDCIFAIRFEGVYPPGSPGNDFAHQMERFVRTTLEETRAKAIMLDLTELQYEYGDAITSLAMPFLERHPSVIPVAVVASPPTTIALQALLTPDSPLGVANFIMFEKHLEALAHLERVRQTLE